jgi:hypothetical protein
METDFGKHVAHSNIHEGCMFCRENLHVRLQVAAAASVRAKAEQLPDLHEDCPDTQTASDEGFTVGVKEGKKDLRDAVLAILPEDGRRRAATRPGPAKTFDSLEEANEVLTELLEVLDD